jgi:hypothetical protein
VSTMQDVRNARKHYEDHIASHKCKTGDGCTERLRLWRDYCGGPRSVAGPVERARDASRPT